MKAFNISVTDEELAYTEKRLKSLDYDHIVLTAFKISDSGCVLEILTEDDFQKNVDWSKRVQHGLIELDWPIKWDKLYDREERELRVLAKQFGATQELHKDMRSAAGRKFAENLNRSVGELAKLIDYAKDRA